MRIETNTLLYAGHLKCPNKQSNLSPLSPRSLTGGFRCERLQITERQFNACYGKLLSSISFVSSHKLNFCGLVMFHHRHCLLVLIVLAGSSNCWAQLRRGSQIELQSRTIQVGEWTREYLLRVPRKSVKPAPVMFGFHGHGGTARNAARTLHLEQHWPEAIVVYMQGIPTPGMLTDPEGKRNGWQSGPETLDDRDLKFFDAVLEELKKDHKVDDTRIYSTGHSNGGGFTYLLWATRPKVFAAVAPSAAAAGKVRNLLTPKPVMHLAGEKDNLVKYRWQELTMAGIRRINQCDDEGKEWSKYGTLYPSGIGAPVVTYIHPGTHRYPSDGPELIVKFFKEHQLKAAHKEAVSERESQKDD